MQKCVSLWARSVRDGEADCRTASDFPPDIPLLSASHSPTTVVLSHSSSVPADLVARYVLALTAADQLHAQRRCCHLFHPPPCCLCVCLRLSACVRALMQFDTDSVTISCFAAARNSAAHDLPTRIHPSTMLPPPSPLYHLLTPPTLQQPRPFRSVDAIPTQPLVAALPAVVGRPATRRQSGFQSCAPTLTSCLCTVLSIVTVTQSSYPPQQSGEDAMRVGVYSSANKKCSPEADNSAASTHSELP